MRHQTIASFAALMLLALMAGGSLAIVARQSGGADAEERNAPVSGFAGYTLAGTLGGPLIPTAPVDVAVDERGRIFVADIVLNRVIAFRPDGELDTSWGDAGMSKRLEFPTGLEIDADGSLYVIQLGNAEVHVFDANGSEQDSWSVQDDPESSGTSIPTAIGLDQQGTIYILDQRTRQIRRFAPDGKSMTSWTLPPNPQDFSEIWPQDIIDWNGQILVSYRNADESSGGLVAFDANGESEILPNDLAGGPSSEGYAPAGIALDPNGEVAVMYLSGDDARPPVVETAQGEWEPAGIPSMAAINGLVVPGMAWDSSGRLLVADPERQRVRIYQTDGSAAGDIQAKSSEGQFAGLDEISVGPDGYLYAADPLLGRVTALDANGSVVTVFQLPGDPGSPLTTGFTRQRMRIAIDSAGAVYVVDEFTGQITKFRQDGEVITSDWIADDDSESPFIAMMLGAGGDERLYAVNIESQDQIHVFNADGENEGPLFEPFQSGSIQNMTVAGDTIYTVELGMGSSPIRRIAAGGGSIDDLADLSSGDGNSNRTGFALARDPTGGLLIAAVNVSSGPEFEYQLLRMDPDGDLHRLGTLDVPFTTLPDIAVGDDGTLYIAAPNDQTVYVYSLDE